ncbi:hypothetical protein BC941DRAFT_416582 [Chlamydoabsidia padenii]|nr:hypothetical protein BC941DRAFT_416582 [Chlamydoabsidia padenii]
MHQKGTDMQGVIWSEQPMDRQTYREKRMNEYDSYISLKKDKDDLRVENLIKNQVVKKVQQDQHFYDFKFAKIKESCSVGHFQLRNLLWATSKNAVRYLCGNTIRQWSPQRGCSKEILNLDTITTEYGRTIKVSSMASRDDIVFVGSFLGDYVLQTNGITYGGRISDQTTTGIVNHADIVTSRNGRRMVLVSGNDRKTRLLDIESLVVEHTFTFSFSINCSTRSPDKHMLCAVGDSTETHLMDTSSGKLVKILDDHHDFSFACCFSPDGMTLATGNQDKTTRIYDVRNLSTPLHVLGTKVGAVRSLHFSNDGRRLAMAEPIDFVHIFDTSNYESSQIIDFFGDIAGVAFTPDDYGLFIANNDDKVGGIFEYQKMQTEIPFFII